MKNIPAFVAFFLAFTGFAQNNTASQGEMTTKNVYLEIPLVNHKEIEQAVSLNGKSFKFILDTGAPLAISREIQQQMNYPVLNSAGLKDANNKSDMIDIVMIDTLKIGGIAFANIPALVLNFKSSPIACQHVEGLIGSNIARFLVVEFDLAHNKVILTDRRDKLALPALAAQPIHLDDQSNAFFEVVHSTGLKDSVQFDSGMGRMYDMNTAKIDQLLAEHIAKPNSVFKGFGIAGQGILGNGYNEPVNVIYSGIALGNNGIVDAQVRTTQAASRMGRELLNYGTLTIDYPNSRYYFVKYPKRLNKPRPNFGFDIIPE